MDCEFAGLTLWLLRGIPRRCTELDVIRTLNQLGAWKPYFWYIPRIRKPGLQNRGYACLGYQCAGDRKAQYLSRRFATCDCPWPLELEKSTATIEHMENHTRAWVEHFVSPGIPDRRSAAPSILATPPGTVAAKVAQGCAEKDS
eukprot:TRINITY_DN13411_c0_g2_i1.p1 TRINITY_DN13411_c0_g2~~TRINITY_DN13411_c0_g2_i1.p1  ORF type:complete len:144 (+),score=9.09 TRINITY_DN13411_c0_g2_i1:40-471(+)